MSSEPVLSSLSELSEPQHFGQCLGFTNTPNDLFLKPMGHCVHVSVDGVLAESSDVHGLVSTSTDPVQLRFPAFDQAGTLLNGRLFFAS